VVYAGFLAATGALAVIDARTQRLPNRIVLPLYLWGAAGLTVCSALGHAWPRLVTGAAAGAVLALVFVLMWYLGPLGFGDVKLIGALGLFLGWAGIPVLLSGLIIGTGIGALVAIALMASGRATRKTRIAYGPFLVAGSWAGLALVLAR
jgi:leader peptidase (prepilin peptidase)/N-methyltransferase